MSGRKKILIPTLHYPPVIGGFEVFTQNIADRLSSRHDIFVVTGKVKGQKNKELKQGVSIYRTGIYGLTNLSWSSPMYLISTLPLIFAKSSILLWRKKIDVVHCQGFFSGLVGYAIYKLFNIPYIITIQSADFNIYYPKANKKILVWLKLRLEKMVFANAAKRHAVSEALKQYYCSFGLKDGIVVPNGVELDIFSPVKDKLSLRKELGFNTDNLFICVSRLEHKNGTQDVIKAAGLLKKELSDFKIIIAGGGSQKEKLEKITHNLGVEDKIIFLGDVLHSELAKYLSASDIFIRPALAEGFGIVYLEAMASGVAVIGTPVGGIVDFLIDGKTGAVCLPENPDSIKEQILRLLNDKQLSQTVIENGLSLVKEKYSWDNVACDIEKIILSAFDYKKVLVLTGIFPPDIGGPATMLVNLCNDLAKNGFKISVLTFGTKSHERYPFKVIKISRSWVGSIKSLVYFIYAIYLASRADILYVQDLYTSGIAGYLAGKIWRKKIVTRFVGDSAWEYASLHSYAKDDLLEFQTKKYNTIIEIRKKIRGMILKGSNALVVASNFLKDVAVAIGVDEQKINVIYNSVDFMDAEIAKLPSKEESKKCLQLDNKIIVSAARLAPWKGMDALIRAFAMVFENQKDISLIILGDGSEYHNLEKLITNLNLSDAVKLVGRVPRSLMLGYLNSADIFALNTNYEGMSHTILEALKFGLPVITTDAGGNPETIDNGKSGILLKYNDRQAMYHALTKLLSDKEMLENLSKGAYEKSREFNWQKEVGSTVKVFKSL